jgi:ribosomal protein L11 methyltransferase
MSLVKLTVLTDAAGAAALETRLAALEPDPPLAVSRFLAEGDWTVEALFEAPLDRARLNDLLVGIRVEAPPAIAAVAERDWVAHVEATLRPITAGPFLVHGPHDRAAAAGHPLAIEIEAGGAFGTAHHATTQGCLTALGEFLGMSQDEAFETGRRGDGLPLRGLAADPGGSDAATMRPAPGCMRRVLDLGTGSGILAIAAAKLDSGAEIVATDIDPGACRIAEDNAALNGVGDRLQIIVADGLAHPELSGPATFDLVLANILAEPLAALAPGLRRALAPDGTIVLSGLLDEQQAMVLRAYEREGLRLRRAWPLDGWVTMAVG